VSAQVSRRSGSRRLARLAVLLAVAAGLVAGWAGGRGGASPRQLHGEHVQAALVVRPDSISVDFVVDMAEIPAYQTRQDTGIGDGPADRAPAVQFRSRGSGDQVAGHISLQAGRAGPLALQVVSTSLSFPPGQAGLSTLRLTLLPPLRPHGAGPPRITYRSDNFTDRVGWRGDHRKPGDRMRAGGPATHRRRP